jgi:protein-arginine kinase activator protein McsA
MLRAARALDFEKAAVIRDQIKALSHMELELRG